MSIPAVAEVLCKTLEDDGFAARVGTPDWATEYNLTPEEITAFDRIDGPLGDALGGVPIGAFRLISKNLDAVPEPLRQRLNVALGKRGSHGPSIPVTGMEWS